MSSLPSPPPPPPRPATSPPSDSHHHGSRHASAVPLPPLSPPAPTPAATGFGERIGWLWRQVRMYTGLVDAEHQARHFSAPGTSSNTLPSTEPSSSTASSPIPVPKGRRTNWPRTDGSVMAPPPQVVAQPAPAPAAARPSAARRATPAPPAPPAGPAGPRPAPTGSWTSSSLDETDGATFGNANRFAAAAAAMAEGAVPMPAPLHMLRLRTAPVLLAPSPAPSSSATDRATTSLSRPNRAPRKTGATSASPMAIAARAPPRPSKKKYGPKGGNHKPGAVAARGKPRPANRNGGGVRLERTTASRGHTRPARTPAAWTATRDAPPPPPAPAPVAASPVPVPAPPAASTRPHALPPVLFTPIASPFPAPVLLGGSLHSMGDELKALKGVLVEDAEAVQDRYEDYVRQAPEEQPFITAAYQETVDRLTRRYEHQRSVILDWFLGEGRADEEGSEVSETEDVGRDEEEAGCGPDAEGQGGQQVEPAPALAQDATTSGVLDSPFSEEVVTPLDEQEHLLETASAMEPQPGAQSPRDVSPKPAGSTSTAEMPSSATTSSAAAPPPPPAAGPGADDPLLQLQAQLRDELLRIVDDLDYLVQWRSDAVAARQNEGAQETADRSRLATEVEGINGQFALEWTEGVGQLGSAVADFLRRVGSGGNVADAGEDEEEEDEE